CSATSTATAVTVDPTPVVAAITGASNVCEGLSTTLASSTTGGTWSSSNTAIATVSTTGVVTGVAAGSATITYSVTNAAGCTASTTASVTVNPSATATITPGGPTTFCAGGSVVLTASTGSTYLWSNGLQTQSITATTSGSYSVTVTIASGCSVTSVATPVTVNALPVVAAITGTPNVCAGSTTTLASSTTGGTWSSSNNAVATVNASGAVTGVTAGLVTITYTVTNASGCINTSTASVTVNALPTLPVISANGPVTICPSSNVILTSSTGFTYTWSTGDQTASIIVSQAGSYYVTVSNANGCTSQSAPINVVVIDTTAPVLVVPNDLTASTNTSCEAVVDIGNALATDNCGMLSITNDAPSLFPIGTTTVTWTATDASGNITVLTQLITVVDDIDPTILVPVGVIAYASTSCEAANVDLGTPTASDNCPAGLVVTNDAPATYPIGVTVVVWTVTDASGNSVTASQNVTVYDTISPTILATDYELTLNQNGQAIIDFIDLDTGSYDNCGIATVTLSQYIFDCDNVGDNEITIVITDNNGNTSSMVVNVFVNASLACGGDTWSGPTIPQAFTPNGNNINDVFEIPGLEGYDMKELYVYDRYGGLVYDSKDYQNNWDGTNSSGEQLPDATYYYLLRVTGGKEKAGYVYINRVQQ
ncbi:MAG: gliding motility-associated C-terminal domain-containing protein, partial [Flavobacteriales bacterium]